MDLSVAEGIPDYEAGVRCLLRVLTRAGERPPLASVEDLAGVGHRVVHGGERFYDSVVIDDGVIRDVRAYNELAPLHNPANLAGIEAHHLGHY